jgi:hypothetical protein
MQGFWTHLWNAAGTGGLRWHWHAWRQRHLWALSRQQIESFLNQIHPKSNHLILIGPSAGWMLPHAWLKQFRRIDVYDIDPLVPWLFSRLHAHALTRAGVETHFHRIDAFSQFEAILSAHPYACLWFDNVLGQQRYRLRDIEKTESLLRKLKHLLETREWGSIHDWLSGPIQAIPTFDAHRASAGSALNPQWTQQRLAQIQALGTWSDHLTAEVFPTETPCHYLGWPYRADYGHWLQMGWCFPAPH